MNDRMMKTAKTFPIGATLILAACATTKPVRPDTVPPEWVPAGYSAAECHIVKPAEAVMDDSPGGSKFSHGERTPKVECTHHTQGPVTTKTIPVCHTKAGKELPLSDCCMNDDGSALPTCTPKLQPPE